MKLRTFPAIWRKLDAEQKQRLCAKSDIGYDYMRVLVSRGNCGRFVAKAIATALHELEYIDGDLVDAFDKVFPEPDQALDQVNP